LAKAPVRLGAIYNEQLKMSLHTGLSLQTHLKVDSLLVNILASAFMVINASLIFIKSGALFVAMCCSTYRFENTWL